ncbi:MAG: UDP-N-acetylglucosamine pyrophosphorylase, partial [Oliverpabstia sp.]|nr:UDP-N-acetylglucosamine pyrophosphorylase [Oliverpabstia sp.]
MENITIEQLYDLKETVAREIFTGKTYPWEVLPLIGEFIVKLGNTLSPEEYDKIGDNIWVAKTASIAPTAAINGPCIIGQNAEVRQCAFIRGNAIVGDGAVVGNSTELKNVILFNKV